MQEGGERVRPAQHVLQPDAGVLLVLLRELRVEPANPEAGGVLETARAGHRGAQHGVQPEGDGRAVPASPELRQRGQLPADEDRDRRQPGHRALHRGPAGHRDRARDARLHHRPPPGRAGLQDLHVRLRVHLLALSV